MNQGRSPTFLETGPNLHFSEDLLDLLARARTDPNRADVTDPLYPVLPKVCRVRPPRAGESGHHGADLVAGIPIQPRPRRESVGLAGVAGARIRDPGGPSIVVDEMPDSPTTGDLELPTLVCLTLPHASRQRPLQPVMPVR